MQFEQDSKRTRRTEKLQWPSKSYLRASWVHVCDHIHEQMQPDLPKNTPGMVKVSLLMT